jgi:hypothetical protein
MIMTPSDLQSESDYRWLERAGIYAGERKLTEHERMLVNQEVQAFENKERNDTHNES